MKVVERSFPDDGPLLAIELSQREGSVALGRRGEVPQCVRFAAAGSGEEDPLLPAVDGLCKAACVRPADLRAVAVSVGPGGFTGLRIAVTAAKCIAEATGCALVAVPSALVAAEGDGTGGPWAVLLASKRATAWLALVERHGARLRLLGEPGVVGAAELAERTVAATCRVALADEHLPAALAEALAGIRVEIRRPRFEAEACWRVGWSMLEREETVDPLGLSPLYPREPEAVTLWRERHGDEARYPPPSA